MTRRPTVRKENTHWTVRLNGEFYAGTGSYEHAIQYADRVATQPARTRFTEALERARAAYDRMENRRGA